MKFPRTRDASDRLILRAEAGYHAVAKKMGVRAAGLVTWESDCLFVPRFDRVVRKRAIERLGLESLYSLAGVADFGAPLRKERQVEAIARFATEPEKEIREYLLRDVLDVALGNTDNHARNTSVLKWQDGRVALSPLYDFAPMILDQRVIARVSRWEDNGDLPDWARVADALARTLDPAKARRWLRGLAPAVIAGKTQAEYAALVGVSPRVLIDFERGVGNPTVKTLEKMLGPFRLELTVRGRVRD